MERKFIVTRRGEIVLQSLGYLENDVFNPDNEKQADSFENLGFIKEVINDEF